MMEAKNSDHLSGMPLAALILSLAVLLLLRWTFAGPLSSIPGPFLSRWTDLPARLSLLSGSKAQYVHSLHEKYGPIVRVGPSAVDVSDVSAVREIHGARSGFSKDPNFYTGGRVTSLFSTADKSFHAERRRLLGPSFSESSMSEFEAAVMDRARLTTSKMGEEMRRKGSTDMLNWWTLFAMDVIGLLCFGQSFQLLESGKKTEYATDIAQMGAVLPLRSAFPSIVWAAGYLQFIPFFNNVALARQRIMKYSRKCTAQYLQLVEEDSSRAAKTLFARLATKSEMQLSEEDLSAESQSYITAGTDTTAVTLTYLVYSVCQHRHVRGRLLSELQTLPEAFTHRDLRGLQYLNWIIDETLRLYGAAPGGLPRVVPPSGATVLGRHVPGGMIVSTQSYTTHRDPRIFPDPERFDPSRWESPSAEARNAFMPFGVGPRSCIGSNLARMELRICTALFFRQFSEATILNGGDDMEPQANFLLVPKGHKCLVQIK